MMVPRPYESILGGKTPKYDFSEVAKKNWSKIGRDRVETGFPQVEGVKPEAGEARRGPNKGHLDPKIGQKNTKKSISSYYGGQVWTLGDPKGGGC